MAFVHRQSCEGVKTELDLFTVPPTQTSIIDSHVVEHQPMASLDSGGPIEYLIPDDDYLDLANTMLHVQVKVTRANGDDLDLADPVGPVNNWLHSLFSQVDVYLNGTLVTPSTNTYAYRAYIETLLSCGPNAKDTELTGQLWHKDMATRMDAVEIVEGAAANAGFVARRANIVRSRVVELLGRLHVDLFLQDKFLINGVDVKIRLVRSKAAFVLMAGGPNPDYRINIVNATLYTEKATLNPTVQMAHIKALEKSTVKYPMRSVNCKVYSIPAGARSHTHENLFLGTLPKRLVLCCIDNNAYNGAYEKNPFYAKNNAITFYAVYVDGRQIPSKPFQPSSSPCWKSTRAATSSTTTEMDTLQIARLLSMDPRTRSIFRGVVPKDGLPTMIDSGLRVQHRRRRRTGRTLDSVVPGRRRTRRLLLLVRSAATTRGVPHLPERTLFRVDS